MSKKSDSFKEGRNSRTGRFEPVEKAKKNPSGSTVESIPRPGRGDTGRGKGPKKK